ncbi:MAG: class II aldolase/adducin family protein [Anaerolineae bacterium]
MSGEAKLREQICQIGRLMHDKDFIDGSAGNISARLDEGRILATPSGLAKGFMTPDQLIVVNMAGERVDTPTPANAELRPTSELLMHLECFRQRPDVHGVVHAHPPYSVALTLVGYDFARAIIPEAVVLLGVVPVTSYATPSSAEDRDAIRDLIGHHDAILLAHHGSLTAAKTVWDAYLLLETLEHTARILYLAEQLGEPRTLPLHQLVKLLTLRKSMGLAREGDAARFGIE